MKQSEKNELARIARETGLCMKCGHEIEDRETLSRDGKQYANCQRCRPSRKVRVKSPDLKTPPPMVDPDDIPSRFDDRDAKRYFAQVGLLLRRRKVTIREINQAFPPPHGVTAFDAIERTPNVHTDDKYISRFWIEDRSRPQPTGYQNWSINPPTDKRPDHDSIYRGIIYLTPSHKSAIF